MTYTAWSRGKDGIPRLAIATSEDLVKWETKGPAFLTAYNGKFKNNSCKSGSIVTKVIDGKQLAVKVNFNFITGFNILSGFVTFKNCKADIYSISVKNAGKS